MIQSIFRGQMVAIQVGTVQRPFHIHLSLLKKTAFFDVHGCPEDQPEIVVDDYETDVVVKDEPTQDVEVASPTNSEFTVKNQDVIRYDLNDKSPYSFEAFTIFLNWLYNQDPGAIRKHDDQKILVKAYIMARRYKAYSLQNKLIERFCAYYKSATINFMDDFVYLVNRVGDDANTTPMVQYMAYQVGYEIMISGFTKYVMENEFLKTFLVEGDRKVRLLLFEALASYTNEDDPSDPADNPKKWFTSRAPV